MSTLGGRTAILLMAGAMRGRFLLPLVDELLLEGADLYVLPTSAALPLVDADSMEKAGAHIIRQGNASDLKLPSEDLVIVAPCTLNTLNKLALGIADSLPLTLAASAIGRGSTVVIAPAMNQFLWSHPTVHKSIEVVQGFGCKVVYPEITPEYVRMAPWEKVADTVYNSFVPVRFRHQQQPLSDAYTRSVNACIKEFIDVGESLARLGVAKGSAGFLSKRDGKGFIVTTSGAELGCLSKEHLACVGEVIDGVVLWQGERCPSSETPLIAELYAFLPDTQAIIHTHSQVLTYSPAMAHCVSAEYLRTGRFGEALKIVEIIKNNSGFGIMKLHGEIILGSSLADAAFNLLRRLDGD